MNTARLILMILFWCCGTAVVYAQPAQESELQPLEHYLGSWDCKFTIHAQQEGDETKKFSGVVKGRWVVGSKFMEQTGSYRLSDSSEPFEIKTMMSFDKQNNRFRYDYFDSSGEIQKSFGEWDAATKTMTSTMQNEKDGNITTIVADFSMDNVERWTIETKNREGNVTSVISGTNTRRTNDR